MKKVLIWTFALLLWGLLALAFLVPPSLLLVLACTLSGHLAALSAICLVLFFTLIPMILCRKLIKSYLIIACTCLLISVCSFGICCYLAPETLRDSKAFSGHFTGNAIFNKLSPANIVPEEDQLRMGAFIAPILDKFMTYKQALSLATSIKNIYAEMDDNFKQTPSALGLCYKELFEGDRQLLHFYEYMPESKNEEKFPVLIFLHGSLGNFKAYTWILKTFADKFRIAIIAPSYGYGNWNSDREGLVLTEIKKYIISNPRLNSSQKYIAGLSNGGIGVLNELQRSGSEYKACILISAVTDEHILNSTSFKNETKAVPFLLIHGSQDERIPAILSREAEKTLKLQEKHVSSLIINDGDHFVFFSKRFEIINNIETFMSNTISPSFIDNPVKESQ